MPTIQNNTWMAGSLGHYSQKCNFSFSMKSGNEGWKPAGKGTKKQGYKHLENNH